MLDILLSIFMYVNHSSTLMNDGRCHINEVALLKVLAFYFRKILSTPDLTRVRYDHKLAGTAHISLFCSFPSPLWYISSTSFSLTVSSVPLPFMLLSSILLPPLALPFSFFSTQSEPVTPWVGMRGRWEDRSLTVIFFLFLSVQARRGDEREVGDSIKPGR